MRRNSIIQSEYSELILKATGLKQLTNKKISLVIRVLYILEVLVFPLNNKSSKSRAWLLYSNDSRNISDVQPFI